MSKDLPEDIPRKEELKHYRNCYGNLNFATASHEYEDYGYQKKKIMRDPMSHRIIEKRRRDRMNNCLADLSRLIPADYLKKGRGRIEKTEIIEMAIKYMRHLQSIISSSRVNEGQCENGAGTSSDGSSGGEFGIPATKSQSHKPIILEHYRLGYLECLSEAMHFLVEVRGYFAGDSLCVQMINHLHKHCDKILKSDSLNQPVKHSGETTSSSSVSPTSANYSNNSPPLELSVSTGSNSDDNQPSHPYERGRSFEPIEDPLRNSTRRYSEPSCGDSKVYESFYPRYAEFENERENPSDSDMEQGYALGGRSKESIEFVGDLEDVPRCNGVDCHPRNGSSSSGIGSNPDHSAPYEDFLVKEENGSSQLRDMLTSPNVNHSNAIISLRKTDGKGNPSSEQAFTQYSVSERSMPVQVGRTPEEHHADAYYCEARNLTMEVEIGSPSDNHHENNAPDVHRNMYKFKNNIKQRFSNERRNDQNDYENAAVKKPKFATEEGSWKQWTDPLMRERLSLLNKGEEECEERGRERLIPESEMCGQSETRDILKRLSFGHKTGHRLKKWENGSKCPKSRLSPTYGIAETRAEDGWKSNSFFSVMEYSSSEHRTARRTGTDGYEDEESEKGRQSIPVFALHSKGSFYIPLTLNQSVLSPFLSLLGLTKSEELEEKPALHPVTISVNFQTSLLTSNSKKDDVPWK